MNFKKTEKVNQIFMIAIDTKYISCGVSHTEKEY